MKNCLFLILLLCTTYSHALSVGDATPTFTINDQFEKSHTIKTDTKTILVAGDKDASTIIRDFLLAKEKGFLEQKQSYYVADISGMPSLISRFIALPKMKKYPFSILLLDDATKDKFSKKEGEITVYTIVEGKISTIKYISTATELAAVFK